jgi:hypothetical protein
MSSTCEGFKDEPKAAAVHSKVTFAVDLVYNGYFLDTVIVGGYTQ